MTWMDTSGLTAITYDPKTGVLTINPEVSGRSTYKIPATSGRPDCGCDASSKGKGRIPSGGYTLNTRDLTNPSLLGDLVRNYGRNGHGGLGGDWGDWRAPLTPNEGTYTFGRRGFFLHGGSFPGSAGCIDVGGGLLGNSQTDQLMQDILNDPDGSVQVIVNDKMACNSWSNNSCSRLGSWLCSYKINFFLFSFCWRIFCPYGMVASRIFISNI